MQLSIVKSCALALCFHVSCVRVEAFTSFHHPSDRRLAPTPLIGTPHPCRPPPDVRSSQSLGKADSLAWRNDGASRTTMKRYSGADPSDSTTSQTVTLTGVESQPETPGVSRGIDESGNDVYFDPRTPITYILGQASLIALAVGISQLAHTPNFGCGPVVQFNGVSLWQGTLYTIPLGLMAALPEVLKLEDKFPALKDVTNATLRSVLNLLGGQWKPVTALLVCLVLGAVAGLGEEMLFRGLLQYEMEHQWHLPGALAILLSSTVFGALHAVTPLYAALAGLASVYFGWIYLSTDCNLAVPIVCHALYDVGALMYAHWTISRMSVAEQENVQQWELS